MHTWREIKAKIKTHIYHRPSDFSGKNKSLTFIHEFHLLLAKCQWRKKNCWPCLLFFFKGRVCRVPHPECQNDSRRKKGGSGKKQLNFSVFVSQICQIFSRNKKKSLKLFITSSKEVSRVPVERLCVLFLLLLFLSLWPDVDERALIGCFWLWRVWGCGTLGWWTERISYCSRRRGRRRVGLRCGSSRVCAGWSPKKTFSRSLRRYTGRTEIHQSNTTAEIICLKFSGEFSKKEKRGGCFEADLEGFLPRVNELVAFEFGALHEGLAALGADVHARSVGVEMLPHGRVIPEHLCAALESKESAFMMWNTTKTQLLRAFNDFRE